MPHPYSSKQVALAQACLHCPNIEAGGFIIIRPALAVELLPPKGKVQRQMGNRDRKEETTTNTKKNIEAFPGFASVHRMYQPQSLITSLFPAGSKTTKHEQIN